MNLLTPKWIRSPNLAWASGMQAIFAWNLSLKKEVYAFCSRKSGRFGHLWPASARLLSLNWEDLSESYHDFQTSPVLVRKSGWSEKSKQFCWSNLPLPCVARRIVCGLRSNQSFGMEAASNNLNKRSILQAPRCGELVWTSREMSHPSNASNMKWERHCTDFRRYLWLDSGAICSHLRSTWR